MSISKPMSMGPELMKLLRDNAMTTKQIAESMGIHNQTVNRWVREYAATGILTSSPYSRVAIPARLGQVPMVYTLAPAWQGMIARPKNPAPQWPGDEDGA